MNDILERTYRIAFTVNLTDEQFENLRYGLLRGGYHPTNDIEVLSAVDVTDIDIHEGELEDVVLKVMRDDPSFSASYTITAF